MDQDQYPVNKNKKKQSKGCFFAIFLRIYYILYKQGEFENDKIGKIKIKNE